MAVKEVCPDIKTLSKSEWARDGFVRVELWKTGEYNIDAQIGGDRAVQQTDRASIIALRDALTEFLEATELSNGVQENRSADQEPLLP